ncbi:MAG: aminopeptidase Metallo peptidase [Acidobacteria bacterium]|nr:aminopeptidase Metallo peptidase [Acidobacteriota bacterium]
MFSSRSIRKVIPVVLFALLLGTQSRFSPYAATKEPANPPVIRITPPAPKIAGSDRLAELAGRRARVSQAMGAKGVLVLFSGEPRVYANDVDYPFRSENNFYYLTNLKQTGSTLVLLPGNWPVLFLPRRSPTAETWTGHMYSPEEAAELSGVREIWDATEFTPFIDAVKSHKSYRPKGERILLSAAHTTAGWADLWAAAEKNEAELYLLATAGSESKEYRREQRFAEEWGKAPNGFNVRRVGPVFSEMRLSKSPLELQLLQHAIDISIEAHERAWANAAKTKWEYEVDAEVAYTFKLRNADNWGYPDIVGCGPNATTLHYEESQGPVKSGQLLLMDVGAEYEHYSADVTRTFPVNGKFSPAQAEIYQIVYDAQEAVARAARPGASLADVNQAGTEVIKDGLLKLGLITDRNSMQYRVWFMHGTSHWLGMNVHDVGGSSKFVPGAVFTNEPGIYVRPDALDNLPNTPENEKFIAAIRPAFEKYKSIGVRIEDDMVITSDGVRWLTEALPRKISDIEAFIARARR